MHGSFRFTVSILIVYGNHFCIHVMLNVQIYLYRLIDNFNTNLIWIGSHTKVTSMIWGH